MIMIAYGIVNIKLILKQLIFQIFNNYVFNITNWYACLKKENFTWKCQNCAWHDNKKSKTYIKEKSKGKTRIKIHKHIVKTNKL